MCVYIRTKFQVSSIILMSFRRGGGGGGGVFTPSPKSPSNMTLYECHDGGPVLGLQPSFSQFHVFLEF